MQPCRIGFITYLRLRLFLCRVFRSLLFLLCSLSSHFIASSLPPSYQPLPRPPRMWPAMVFSGVGACTPSSTANKRINSSEQSRATSSFQGRGALYYMRSSGRLSPLIAVGIDLLGWWVGGWVGGTTYKPTALSVAAPTSTRHTHDS